MSRKSLIICLAVLAVMILGIGIAVAVLYSGTEGGTRPGNDVPDEERYLLLPAVPADAVFVACLSDSEEGLSSLLSGAPFASELADTIGSFRSVASSRMAVSLHYSGHLQALYVFDAGKASAEPSEDAVSLMDFAGSCGMYAEYADCSALTDGGRDISRRSLVVMSSSETLVKSSLRHLGQSLSVMDASGFPEASHAAGGSDVMFFSNLHAKTLMAEMFSKKFAAYHPFVASMSQWTVADLTKSDDSGVYMNIYPVFDNDPSEFMTVLSKSEPGISKVAQMLPSYVISVLTLPMKSAEPYMTAYQEYMDSRQALQRFRKRQKDLKAGAGISPADFVGRLDVREVAKASFMAGGKVEEVNLMRIAREDTLLFVGRESKSFKDYKPAIHIWPYSSFMSSVFGKYFELKDESHFTYMDGWVISGSFKAVDEYVSGRALSYNLVEYMSNAGQKNMLTSSDAVMTAYYSFTEYPEGLPEVFAKPFLRLLEPFRTGCDYCPAVLSMEAGKGVPRITLRMPKLNLMKTKAPEFVRDTTVTVPQGPFRVKNSGTGKMNLFYQNTHGFLCLQEEGGKGLWGFPFKGRLCGTAYNVDYYANGKLQIIFGSGSSIYIIDRLGHYVRGFPLDLGKEILLGPDLYDFNGARAYNIMVLHKDNTIEMYNLKGRKPASWKSITAPETIKALPERIVVGGKTFWVVRTAIQTLIYPFSGGTALTAFKGNEIILPDSKVEIADDSSVRVECYDGKTRTVKIK